MTDYATMYDGYWSDPARWGTSSLRDVEATGEAVLNCCGGGRLLDVGCGMGALVRSLLRLGVDATGLDVAQKCVDEGNRAAPGRFLRGSMLELPFEDGAFETVVSTDVLEHLAEDDVPRALAELARVARRSVFLRVATTPDRDGAWHLTVHDRAWWERRCFEAGLRRHPMMLAAIGYEALEAEGWQATLVMQRVPPPALERWPLDSLRVERDLHMDMLREPGRRSDAHLARYWLACQFVRPGDVVLDAACGLGYGSAVLAAASQAALVLGVDSSQYAIDYAEANYGGDRARGNPAPGGDPGDQIGPPRFRRADATDLDWLGDSSIDVAVSFETLEHLPDPGRFLDTLRRVLRPGGRVVLSVPNRWVDESGTDPNPHHLHVYDWDRLREEVGARFIVEKRFAQAAGGGLTLRNAMRSLREVAPDAPGDARAPAEWWLAVGMKDPVGAAPVAFGDRSLPDHSARAGFNVAAFGRDYENPWLVRAMVALGQRCTSKAELGEMARRVLERAARGDPGAASPDVGAALCVMGYRLLDRASLDAAPAADWLAQAAAFERAVDQTPGAAPHARRWVISNAYLAAQVLLATGRRHDARDAFRRCAAMDVLAFSPLLASKTIDASWQAGLIAACDGDAVAAVADFRRGMAELVRVLSSGDWANIIGSVDDPLPFGLVDLQQGVEFAARCAFGIACAGMFQDRPGLAWQLVRRRAMADLRQWTEQQQGAMEWLRAQRREYEQALHEARQWIARQQEGRAWLERNSANLAARLDELTRHAGDERDRLRAVIQEQKRAAEWLDAQRRQIEQRLRERDATIAELRAFIEAQRASIEERVRQKDARLAELQAAVARLTQTRDWALKQRDAFKARAEVQRASDPGDTPTQPAPE